MAVVTALVRVALPSSAVTPALPQVLIDWINDVLVEERIIVKQLEEDLYDGQVLQKLLGESAGGAAPPAPCKGPVQGHLRPGHTVLYMATSVTHPESRLEAPVLSPQLPGGVPRALGFRAPVLSSFLRWAFHPSSQPRVAAGPAQLPGRPHLLCCWAHTAKGSVDGGARGTVSSGLPSLPACARPTSTVSACGPGQPFRWEGRDRRRIFWEWATLLRAVICGGRRGEEWRLIGHSSSCRLGAVRVLAQGLEPVSGREKDREMKRESWGC